MSRSTCLAHPLLIVVGCTDPVLRGYCMERAAAAYPIALINPKPPTWQQDLVVDHEVADPRDPQAVIAAGHALAERHTIAGVLSRDEYALVPTAHLTARLGLPGALGQPPDQPTPSAPAGPAVATNGPRR